MIEKSLFSLALGLKNAGTRGVIFSVIASLGTKIFVFPSIISVMAFAEVCNNTSFSKPSITVFAYF